jgi:hypothetical protein
VDRRAGGVGLQQRPPVVARAVVPARQVAAVEQRLDALQLGAERADLLGDRDAVGRVDVAPDLGVRAGHAGHVAEARPDLAQRLAVVEQPPRGLRGEHVGEHVREVAEHRDEPIVGGRVERDRPRAHVDHEAVQPLVEQPAGVRQGRQVPDGVLEQVRAGVLDPGRLGAGDRMAADEARVVDLVEQLLLGGADVRDHAVLPRAGERLLHQARERAHRRAGEADRGAVERLGDGPRGAVDRAELERGLQPVRAAPPAHHLGARDARAGRQPDRAADQADPEDRDPHPSERARRACTAAASSSSTSEVVSQSMQASVIDCP